ncbi:1-acyl-sn-glycerol-3-phosphate acyltransferase [Longimycelium tulufanense]|uniref:1-acyl-sn-glycerol-3-phosphate acyltransferase n=1 Tax=Longimycelium tulufanense TaxID=907463 RepID=A0A8J3C683_9PSEU|nr:lysophospholipid acyltransferase family protein [Longimycelium tulufanense]GGM38130.1 1-acyl-sn-glycerol-3-phosphate acyltransferase [Longimycelium tulufanense]
MVALPSLPNEPTRRKSDRRGRVPVLWRALMLLDRAFVATTGRLEVTGGIPEDLRERPLLLAANHIGVFDVFVLIAACRRIGVAPRFMATAGLFDTPIVGGVLRRSGHVRVDRGKGHVIEAFRHAVTALQDGAPVVLYPEGRISRDPGLWPERGKSGVARMALAAHAPVVPVSQWGAHEAVYWGTPSVHGWSDIKPLVKSWLRAVRNRPTFRVHFGAPVDLADLSADRPGDAIRARDRIMRAITADLAPLRRDEPNLPRFHDPTRPTDGSSPWKP